ncbi:MAG TPA: ABC transporter permease [Thermomicrobiaceae bacterium]|nr:ABC transporter permease [Thermomicrobiaceae bacterium]
MDSFRAELMLLRRRAATWVLLAIAILMGIFFSYVLPYTVYRGGSTTSSNFATGLSPLLPDRLVSTLLGGFPFYFGMLTLILGALAFGSEYGWGTLKTTLMQRSGRTRLLLAKLAALGVMLVVFVAAIFVVGAASSVAIGLGEGAALHAPSLGDLARGLASGWLILAVWALFGALLAILSRGTALAIGVGILYGLVIEGVVAGFGESIRLLRDVSQVFLRTNAYSLIAPLQTGSGSAAAGGPGAFSGPYLDASHALLVILAYLLVFSGLSALLLARRDVT